MSNIKEEYLNIAYWRLYTCESAIKSVEDLLVLRAHAARKYDESKTEEGKESFMEYIKYINEKIKEVLVL